MPQTNYLKHCTEHDQLRIPNTLVKDRIAETVKSIRNLYDTKQKKRKNNGGMKPGSLLG